MSTIPNHSFQCNGWSKQIVSLTVTEKSVNTSPTIVLSGCNFTGCSINFSGNAASQTKKDVVKEKCIAEKCLEGLDVDDTVYDIFRLGHL